MAMAGGAGAQGVEPASAGGLTAVPSPYYLGASQGFTHDSNVFRVPFGPSDNYSSTSLLAGFDQPFSRQRVFGSGTVSLNRYQRETELDNTSYALLAGLDWETIGKLAGTVTTTLNRQLAAPAANVSSPGQTRTLERRKGIDASARWGGDSTLSLDGRLGYSSLDYSGSQNNASESTYQSGSLGLSYRPGSLLRTGIAVRVDRTRAPFATQRSDGSYQGNEITGKNLDLLADYNNGSSLTVAGRLSYTRQTYSNIDDVDFSGLTGSLNLGYRATGKLAFNLGLSRDAGYNGTTGGYAPVAVSATPVTASPTNTTSTLYENNQVTNSIFAGATYAATAKINMTAGARYSRAKIITVSTAGASGSQGTVNVTDETRGATLGANYAFSRNWNFACSISRDRREVSGAISYSYANNIAACSGQFIWR